MGPPSGARVGPMPHRNHPPSLVSPSVVRTDSERDSSYRPQLRTVRFIYVEFVTSAE